jgi:glycosyltransferase involved in cell wall biosynthesis
MEALKMKIPIRVLFINHSVRDGGAGRSLFYMLKHIDKTRVIPFVLVPREDVFTELLKKEGLGDRIIVERRFPEKMYVSRFKSDGFRLGDGRIGRIVSSRVLRLASVVLNAFHVVWFVLGSPSLIRERKIDLIYCNGTPAKIAGTVIGILTRRPVIWHVRSIQRPGSFRYYLLRFLSLFPTVRGIVCVSNATAEQFSHVSEKTRVVYNGVDFDEFDPEGIKGVLRDEYGIPEGVIIVGSVGRLIPKKGYEDMVRVASNIRDRVGEEGIKGIRFVVIGDTPDYFIQREGFNYTDYLKGLVRESGLEDVFIFTGYRRDIRPYIRDFDIFVIPSNYSDPFPRAVIEAMSFALPVVGYGVGGIVEAVEHGVTGLLCEPEDVKRLSDSVFSLILDGSLRASMGIAGRERAKRLFCVRSRTKEIEERVFGSV